MADKAAEALNNLNFCKLHGISVDSASDALFQFAADFFDTEDGVASDDDEDDSGGEENDVLERLHLPDAPDHASDQELQNAEELLVGLGLDANGNAADVSDAEEEEDGPTVVVDQARVILDPVADLFVSSSTEVEKTKIAHFNCKCKLSEKGGCYKQFSEEFVHRLRVNMAALTCKEKDMFIMGKVSCHINLSKDTACTKRKTQKERKQYRTTFMIENKVICRDTFRFMHW
jgi:hypothetical protein